MSEEQNTTRRKANSMTASGKQKKRQRSETASTAVCKHFLFTNAVGLGDVPTATVTHLLVDSSVQKISEMIVMTCTALVQVQLPDTLSEIRMLAFAECSALKSVQFYSATSPIPRPSDGSTLDDGLVVTPQKSSLEIGPFAFFQCSSLRKVSLCSPSTTLKGEAQFRACIGLIAVKLPEGLQVINESSFQSCEALTKVDVPSSVVKIDQYAFRGCGCLASFDFPSGLLEIGAFSFAECRSIQSLDVPSSVSTINESAFGRCNSLRRIALPPTLERIEHSLLISCPSLEYIEIPDTVTSIASLAFKGCCTLSHVRIPSSVNQIGNDAFEKCTSLLSLELPEGLKPDGCDGLYLGIYGCVEMVNLTIPSLRESLDTYFEGSSFLEGTRFGKVAPERGRLASILKHRFDNCPLHKLCYYQSYYPEEEAVRESRILMVTNQLVASASKVDLFGMTPLHVFLLAQSPRLSMLPALMDGLHPEYVIRERDSFGCTPMDYVCLNRMPGSNRVIRELLQKTVVDRVERLGLGSWKSNVLRYVDLALSLDWSLRRRHIGSAYLKVALYERMEILCLVELFLWKIKIDEAGSKESLDRQSCRFRSGASIVIPNVLVFLGQIDEEDYECY
eukprot:scaffold1389_cov122-Cylindrotheca_fusiformis.AAC.5